MLAKLIAHAPTRGEAIALLQGGLARTVVLGLPTNRAMLAECLSDAVFQAGDARIDFLNEHAPALRERIGAREAACLVAAVAATHSLGLGKSGAFVLPSPFERPLRLRHRGVVHDMRVFEQAPDGLTIAHLGQTTSLRRRAVAGGWRLTTDGITGTAQRVQLAALRDRMWHVQVDAVDLLIADASFEPAAASSRAMALELKAAFSGKVVAVHAAAGQAVKAGETLLVIESMKLEHSVTAARDSRVKTVAVEPGQQVSPGQLLLSFEAA